MDFASSKSPGKKADGLSLWWFPDGGSSFMGERSSATFYLKFKPLFTSILPLFPLFCDFLTLSVEALTAPLQIGTQ